MNNNWRERKGLFFSLIIAASFIWGYNLYQIIVGVSASEEEPIDVQSRRKSSSALSVASTKELAYKGKFRDPFQHQLYTGKPKPKPKPPPQKPKRKPRLPRLLLNGIVGETAMIEGKNKTIYFVKIGDAVEGVKVLEVKRNQVVLEFNGDKHILQLNN